MGETKGKMKPLFFKEALLSSLILLFVSCGKQNEGCTDPAARNFDVSADKNCCCEYPQFQLQYLFKMGVNLLKSGQTGDTLTDAGGHLFTVVSAKFLFSDFIFLSDAQSYLFDKRLWVFPKGKADSLLTVDDYITPSFGIETFNTFTYKIPPVLTGMRFKIGVSDSVLIFDPYRIRNVNHPLYPIKDGFFDTTNNTYNAGMIEIYFPTDSIFRKFPIPIPATRDISYSFDKLKLKEGFNTLLALNFKMDKLFDQIDWIKMDSTAIVSQLSVNLNKALE
jgi:hypothetical protein